MWESTPIQNLYDMEVVTQNWAEIALAVITALGTITALTESTKDDKIVDVAGRIVSAVVFGRTKKRRS